MKTIFKSIIALFTVGVMTSCYSVMDQTPTDQYSDAVVWNDAYLLEAHLAELYACVPVMVQDAVCIMPNPSGSKANVDNDGWTYCMAFSSEMEGSVRTLEIADEAKYNFGAQGHLLGMKDNGIQANGNELEWWGNSYYSIRNLNNFIERAAESTITEINIEHRIGEARWLRAFCYFAMVKRYGGVPLITKVQDLEDDYEVLYPKRNTEKEIYDFILSETEDLAGILPSEAEAGRASKWAALALRSRAALYAASIAQFGTVQLDGLLGIPSGDAASYYQICYDASADIINNSPHGLYNENADKVQNFKDIFLNKGNREGIMVRQHTGNGYESGGGDNRWSWDMVESPRPNV